MTSIEELASKLIREVSILYVAEQPATARQLQEQIRQQYAGTVTWSAFEKSEACVQSAKYDLVLVELAQSDKVSAAIKAMKKHQPEIPIIVVAGDAALKDIFDMSQCGIISVMAKPFNSESISVLFRQFRIKAARTVAECQAPVMYMQV